MTIRQYVACFAGVAMLGSASARAQTIAIVGGTVYPVSGPVIQNGTVLMRNGKIVAVGTTVTIPADAQRIDATGKVVTPGLINAGTQLGVKEVLLVDETRDASAQGRDNIAAAFRVWEGIDSRSVLLAPTRQEGVTSVVVAPSGGLIAGQAALIDLVDGTASDMLNRAPVAMVAQVNNPSGAGTTARGELLSKLRTLFEDVKFYRTHRADYDKNGARTLLATRADLEALLPVLDGTLPLAVLANRKDDIDAAVRIATDFHLKLIIVGGAEAWMIAPRLAAANVSVLTGAMNNVPSSFETLNQRQENASLLHQAGVKVAIIGNAGDSDEDYYNVRNVKYEAGNSVAYGMSHDDALRSVTLTPAELFGASDRVGSLQAGRDANVVVWSGDPFEFSTQVEHVFIRGRDVRGEKSRQDLLTEKYKTLPK